MKIKRVPEVFKVKLKGILKETRVPRTLVYLVETDDASDAVERAMAAVTSQNVDGGVDFTGFAFVDKPQFYKLEEARRQWLSTNCRPKRYGKRLKSPLPVYFCPMPLGYSMDMVDYFMGIKKR